MTHTLTSPASEAIQKLITATEKAITSLESTGKLTAGDRASIKRLSIEHGVLHRALEGVLEAEAASSAAPDHLCDEECGDPTHPHDGRVTSETWNTADRFDSHLNHPTCDAVVDGHRCGRLAYAAAGTGADDLFERHYVCSLREHLALIGLKYTAEVASFDVENAE